ncbi:hypothetical protein [Hymenobacter negativus]|uniref:Glycosyltransferase RgtA/B/C/D-like domain-containing protein n=1 Tax=Hymenobacter negativus TaxID=2795026 RepID=A0ABS3QAX7_9BACT|nr:hypothetical protein [Hymenobacter negativus]MBO2008317.1 hypothetical protein [Hymenobacter negativus]
MLSSYQKTSSSQPAASTRRPWPWSKLAVGLVTVVLLRLFVSVDNWQEYRVTKYDVFGYYLYLPAKFIYHDLAGLSFVPAIIDQYQLTNRGNPAHPLGNFEVSRARTEPDRYVIKYTMGLAILYFPFFETAHLYTTNFSHYSPDGYSPPYQIAAYLAGLVYALVGLLVLRRFLRYYFSDGLTAALLIIAYCGTNYLCYSSFRGLYSHNFLFALHATTLLLTHLWVQQPRQRYALGLSVSIGLAILIRPTEIIIGLVPLLLGVASLAGLRTRLQLLWQQRGQLLLFGFGVGLIWLPQLLYWHHMSGHWFYDSYPGESFNFKHPKLKSGIYSFNNGWLTYTPVMGLSLIGIAVLWWRRRDTFWLMCSYLALHLWISFSWWCWWYMDSFGSRAMVQTYPLLCLPLGYLLREMFQQGRVITMVTAVLLAGFVGLNCFQFWQLQNGIFVSEYMTQRYYLGILGRTQLTKDILAKFDTNEPDPPQASKGFAPVFVDHFDKGTGTGYTADHLSAGQAPGFRLDGQNRYSPAFRSTLGGMSAAPGQWVQASVQAFFPDKEYNINQMPGLVIEWQRGGQPLKWQSVRITNKVGPVSTVYGGTAGVWDTVAFTSQIPTDAQPGDQLAVYVRNDQSDKALFIDDLTVSVIKP